MKQKLYEQALKARDFAYVPYSKFPVGCAVLTKNNKIYQGANIENASYGLSNCAERTAIFKAISEGESKFQAICVVADSPRPIPPCGACRQVLVEFCSPDTVIWLANTKGEITETTIEKLLPGAFTAEDIV